MSFNVFKGGAVLLYEVDAIWLNLMKKREEIEQFDFWSQNPCGSDGSLSEVMQHRYKLEPWLPIELESIPRGHKNYLEIGCGQGIDSYYICKNLSKEARYLSIDYSSESVRRAASFVDEALALFNFEVLPKFVSGDALSLEFGTEKFDFVFSNGVIHHTPDPQKAIYEIHRVLKKGGGAKIFLYRKYSLKVGIAQILRLIQTIGDKLLFKDRCIYNKLKQRKAGFFGSMFLECFGVPWMECYTRSELEKMFKDFDSVKIEPYAFNIPASPRAINGGYNPLGYLFKIDLIK